MTALVLFYSGGQRFEESWPACAHGEAFVHLFTINCCERFSKGWERNPALWDKRPFVFNQSLSLNEKMFQMTRVKWKGGLGRRSSFRTQIKPLSHNCEGESCENRMNFPLLWTEVFILKHWENRQFTNKFLYRGNQACSDLMACSRVIIYVLICGKHCVCLLAFSLHSTGIDRIIKTCCT